MSRIFSRYPESSFLSSVSFTWDLISLTISTTLMFAPPCLGPFSDDRDADTTEYVSEPAEVMTRAVNVELLPPPCSMWSTRAASSTFASSSVYPLSGLRSLRMFSAMESSLFGLWMIRLSPSS